MNVPPHLKHCFWLRLICNQCNARYDVAVAHLGDIAEHNKCPGDRVHTDFQVLPGSGRAGMTSATSFPYLVGPIALDTGAEEIREIRQRDWQKRKKTGWKRTTKAEQLRTKAAAAGSGDASTAGDSQ